MSSQGAGKAFKPRWGYKNGVRVRGTVPIKDDTPYWIIITWSTDSCRRFLIDHVWGHMQSTFGLPDMPDYKKETATGQPVDCFIINITHGMSRWHNQESLTLSTIVDHTWSIFIDSKTTMGDITANYHDYLVLRMREVGMVDEKIPLVCSRIIYPND